LGSLWKGKLLDFRLVETFFENIESSNELFDWLKQIVQPIKKPVRTLSIFMSMAFVKDANGISFKNDSSMQVW
jgi:hypothetical protein